MQLHSGGGLEGLEDSPQPHSMVGQLVPTASWSAFVHKASYLLPYDRIASLYEALQAAFKGAKEEAGMTLEV